MSSMSIEWHENCLKNQKTYVERCAEELKVAQAKYLRAFEEYKKYERQIERAKKLGKDRFDSERFKDG